LSARDPLAARMTRDIDLAIDRADLETIRDAVRSVGLEFPHTAGVDMLVDSANPKAHSAVRLIMMREKVRSQYLEPVPGFSTPVESAEGILLAPVADLVRRKLTSYRLKDRVHIQDLDGVGLITPAIEAELPAELRQRLIETRASS
jgi:signal recognition particle subunit SEC65